MAEPTREGISRILYPENLAKSNLITKLKNKDDAMVTYKEFANVSCGAFNVSFEDHNFQNRPQAMVAGR